MLPCGRAGLAAVGAVPAFAPVTEPAYGGRPGWTGSPGNSPARPGPHPRSQPIGGQLGRNDGASGADPARPRMSPAPRTDITGAEQETWARYGIQGFSDQLQVRDRHVYWDRGRQRFSGPPASTGGGRNPQLDGPARADLRAVNISVNPQIGSDASRFADDLTRPYTWLGQQDGTVVPVYGGVPGLWVSYGNRGLADGIHDPSDGQGGMSAVWSGPPHGLHSDTMPSGKQTLDRYKTMPQMRPARIDRPSNSTIAGQSYSQTVQFQGQAAAGQPTAPRAGFGLSFGIRGRA